MKEANTKRVTAWLVLIGLASFACTSTQTGKEGELEFSYVTDDDVRDFNKAIAVGAKLDLTVRMSGNGSLESRRVTLNEATSSDEAALTVVGTSGDSFTIEATGTGSAELRVDATSVQTGEGLIDAIDMRGAEPEVLILSHTCGENPTGRRAKYLVSQPIYIPFEMELSDGQPVIGYGYYPVSAAPEGALTPDTDHKDQAFIHFTTADTAGEADLSSTIDDTTLPLELVEAGTIDGAELVVSPVLREGRTELFYVLPTTGGEPICQAATPVAYEVKTPETCTAREASAPVTEEARQYGWFSITGVTEGQCIVEVTYSAGNSGDGASAELSIGVNAP